jgi:hypothetical protein
MKKDTYFCNWLNLTCNQFYINQPNEVGILGSQVSDYISSIWLKLVQGNSFSYVDADGPFSGLVVETWFQPLACQTDDAIDGDVENLAGGTWPSTNTTNEQKIIRINSNCVNKSVYCHEFFHNYGFQCGMYNGYNTKQIGFDLEKEYEKLRSADFTQQTPKAERFAEDGKFLFSDCGLSPNDDGRRKPDQVVGLKIFIQFSYPVYWWLKDKPYSNFEFNAAGNYFIWWSISNNRWEAFGGGNFQYYNGSFWKAF